MNRNKLEGPLSGIVRAIPDPIKRASMVQRFGRYLGIRSNDIDEDDFKWALAISPSPQTLRELVGLSKAEFGWYTPTVSRCLEGPWIIEHLGALSGQSVLDIGAGVSPLPLYLARRGANVVTVDNHSTLRDSNSDPRSWNDWGFLDYQKLDEHVVSHNADILQVDLKESGFNSAYSMSVVEHMPAQVRRDLWPRIHGWLKEGGALLLTLDLAPGTQQLWNFAEGQPVDAEGTHGDLDDVTHELQQAGFRLTDEVQFCREVRNSRTDIALLALSKGRA